MSEPLFRPRPELVSGPMPESFSQSPDPVAGSQAWALNQVQGEGGGEERCEEPRKVQLNDTQSLLRLQSWFSPAFPIGAFSYSHGLESAIEAGRVHDRHTLQTWTASLLREGTGRIDGWFFAQAWQAAPDPAAAAALAEEAAAWVPTAELALETEHQGEAFLNTVRSAWPHAALAHLTAALSIRPPLPVAAGFVAGVHGVPLLPSVSAFLQAFAANIVSAGVRLIPLGQTDGQIATAGLEPIVTEAAADAVRPGDDQLWSTTPAHEIYAMQHETQYARIFRS